ncbi:TPA: hypothetical protein N0F65_007963 [Lagenidium giganteum]|uniref:Uncharacterized protein n=1 Tax=Lagenidium giganteum TaxID=4803 RepID=A0AAV2YLR2_9STRA|nr:TPA: hypothetical protein N0F65_007963 [Lagenidium giganteum]
MEEAHEVVREYVVPPVVIPREYRQQERTGVRVGGSRVRFTRDAHMHHRKAIRLMHTVEEDSEYIDTVVPTIHNAWMCTRKPAKSRRCKSARLD